RTNQINLQTPEFVSGGTFGLRVLTPAGSASHSFRVALTTNRTDLRLTNYPVLKPHLFTAGGTIRTNHSNGPWHYFQIDVPTNLPGWRLVLSSSTTNTPDLYLRRGQLPDLSSFDQRSEGQSIDTIVLTDTEATPATYFIGVYLPVAATSNSVYTLSAEIPYLRELVWDPGLTHQGTEVFTNSSPSGGNYF